MSQQIPEAEFVDIMTNYDMMKDECKELEQLAQEAQTMRRQDALDQINKILEPIQKDLQKMVNKIKISLVGRLVRQNTIKDLLYEVQSFDPDSCNVILRRLFDQNMIQFSRNNHVPNSIFKHLKGSVLQRLYEVVPNEEEYDIRKKLLPDSKLVIKF